MSIDLKSVLIDPDDAPPLGIVSRDDWSTAAAPSRAVIIHVAKIVLMTLAMFTLGGVIAWGWIA